MTKLKLALVATALAGAAGMAAPASAAMSSQLPTLKLLSDGSEPIAQPVFWQRVCHWHDGRRRCRWVWVRRHR